ncbi:MAG TPA: RdgB/HAM1 family non-canonical purine NTP pyrophosphatase [Chitinophagaceae bacterium]|nr:RdgB/HAM1 family non-canonical purine NTP pyrophosphatase [Chitinophagaceae bacterium]HRX93555.1 RdgB/HAM1 family non-canonical purine NTP pyrophosphatase [Chitinophagaceae bacterium]
MKLIFATNNPNKVKEIRSLLADKGYEIISLKEAGIDIDIPEPYETLHENASAKSGTIYKMTGISCFSEDTGLEVTALNGEPGVKSARYAGENKSFEANIDKLLLNLAGENDRSARFRTVISLIIDGKETLFEGICEGHIILERKGNGGFGYDPVFQPKGYSTTFAEMSLEEKAAISHRGRATVKLVTFLNTLAANT